METYKIKTEVDTGNSIKDLEALRNELDELAQSGQQNTSHFKQLETELNNLSNSVTEAGESIGQLGEAVTETDKNLEGLSMTAGQSIGGSIEGMVGGFTAVQGVMGSLGIESENLNQALLKVQSAMAISKGVEQVRNAIPAFQAFGKTAITALKGIKGAVMATGIGLLVVAVGTLVAYWDDIKAAMSGVSAEQERLNKVAQRNLEIANENLANFSKEEEILRLKGVSEKEILNLKIAQTDEAIKASEIAIKQSEQTLKAQVQAEKNNKAILKGIIGFITAPLQLLLKTIDDIAAWVGEDTGLADTFNDLAASLIFDPNKVEKEGQKAIEEQKKALDQLKHDREVSKLQIENIDKEAAKNRAEIANKLNDELDGILQDYNDRQLSQEEQEVLAVQRKYEAVLKNLKKGTKKYIEVQEAMFNDVNEIRTKYAAEELKIEQEKQAKLDEFIKQANEQALQDEEDFNEVYQQQINSAKQNEENAVNDKYHYLIETAKQYGWDVTELEKQQTAALTEINDKYRKEEEEKNKALQDAKYDAVQGGLQALLSLSEAFAGQSEEQQKRAFKFAKAVNIAQATIDTYRSAVTAFKSAPNPILGAVFSAIAIASGIANIKKIASTTFEGGSTPSDQGGAGGLGGIITPEFNIVGNSPVNQLAELQGQPVQAYVVSGEVTTAQALDRNRIVNATL